ncbi:MAG: hypothetical protein Q8K30_01130 [Candidatus Gracilibacteria bacterium]|nr:hypothetical protein [Candidatus Gracilibacteria bacterium]
MNTIKDFSDDSLLSLDDIVMGALELFEITDMKRLDISDFKRPLIAGSGNAIVTAKIIFGGIDAIFCDETNFEESINKDVDGLVILSASGEKHAIVFAKKAIEKGIKAKLLTCSKNSTASKIIGEENTIVTAKNREPYTYNTSTYMGWVIAYTGENPSIIKKYIQEYIDPILNKTDFSKYDSYLLVTPDKFAGVNQLFIVKFIELFGRKIARDVFSYEQMKHATTVVPHSKELSITFGKGELECLYGELLNFPLPENCSLAGIMAIGYYVIGRIQNSYPQYFKENIKTYIENLNKYEFGKGLNIIVE